MKTLVELRISQKATAEIIKEVRVLSKSNTSNNKSIIVLEDPLDDRLLLITFESYRGRQMDLANSIRNSYAHFLDCYSDISIQFETRNNRVSIEERAAVASRKEVTELVEGYFNSIDQQDLESLPTYLSDRIKLIPKPSIRSSKDGVRVNTYISYLEKVLAEMTLKHEANNLTTSRDWRGIKCQCQIEIKGTRNSTNDYFIAVGTYSFNIVKRGVGNLEITEIKQTIEEIEGSKKVSKLYIK